MLRLENISKSFIQRGLVLDNLNLEAELGASIAITGPSGSGKTTLMNIIGALDKPDSGNIWFNGTSILKFSSDELSGYRNRNIGFVFQDHLLLNHLTVKENIMLPLFAERISKEDYDEKDKYCASLMDRIGITNLSEKFPFQISGGEAQRATLVRALISKPSLVLADEPTGSLDSKNAENLGRLLIELNIEFKIALIVATHSNDLASRMGLHMKLENGKLNI
ncbi:MAG TPA: ABC transporter ATP-binding protein [Bacteroidales bacterium]|nr:ABC transporter ATP-binding protein [Bacteroidales bacterium]